MLRILLAVILMAFAVPSTVIANDKVTICHVPPGNPAAAHTITVSENALKAHLGENEEGLHGGDYRGECVTMSTPPEPSPTPQVVPSTTPTPSVKPSTPDSTPVPNRTTPPVRNIGKPVTVGPKVLMPDTALASPKGTVVIMPDTAMSEGR